MSELSEYGPNGPGLGNMTRSFAPEHVEGTESPAVAIRKAFAWAGLKGLNDSDVRRAERAVHEGEAAMNFLLTEREELREALRTIAAQDPRKGRPNDPRIIARSVLSSRETTDSPTCPTCGSDDPKVRLNIPVPPFDEPEVCDYPFHSATTEGTSE